MRVGELIVGVVALLVAAPARGLPPVLEQPWRDVGPCRIEANEDAVVEATVVAIQQPAYRCGPSPMNVEEWIVPLDSVTPEAPTEHTGCLIVAESPECGTEDGPRRQIELDGVSRSVTAFAYSYRACGLAPGKHVAETCSRRGPVRCEADVTAGGVTMVRVQALPARAQLRIDRVFLGSVRAGSIVSIDPVAFGDPDRVSLPSRAAYAWRAGTQPPQVRVCEKERAAPGCSRCQTSAADPASALVALLVAGLLARRRR